MAADTPGQPAIRCLSCDYPLDVGGSLACPECGRGYDPDDPGTYSGLHPPSFRTGRLPEAIVATYAVVWYAHVLSTQLGDPLGLAFDLALFVAAIPLKLGCILATVALLGRIAIVLAHRRAAAARAFGTGAAMAVAVVGLLALLRDPLSELFSNAAVEYYGTRVRQVYFPAYDLWLTAWRYGLIFLIEAGLAVALVGATCAIGYRLGRARWAGVAIGASIAALLVAHAFVFNLFVVDWDIWHGDIFSGMLLMDLAGFFVPQDPYGSFGAGAGLFVLVWWRVCRRTLCVGPLVSPSGTAPRPAR